LELIKGDFLRAANAAPIFPASTMESYPCEFLSHQFSPHLGPVSTIWYNTVMEITETQYQQIEHCMPRQRGSVSHSNLQILNAILYVTEHGCKWRGLTKRFGNWHTIYTRMNRWAKSGVLQKVFMPLNCFQYFLQNSFRSTI